MSTAQRNAVLSALSATVFLAGWLIDLRPAGTRIIQAARIEYGGSPHSIKAVKEGLELVDPPQATATFSTTKVTTPVLGPKPIMSSAASIDGATDDFASPEPVTSVAEEANPEPPLAVAPAAMSATAAPADGDSAQTPVLLATVPAAPLFDEPTSLREMRSLESLFTSDPVQEPQLSVRPVETQSECPAPEICIDGYLWGLYERTPKIDTNKVVESIKTKIEIAIKKKQKTLVVTRTVIRTKIKYVVGDFTQKDPIAAQESGCPLRTT